MNKALILPIVSLIALVVKQSTGYEFDDQMLNTITDGLMALIILIGIFTQPKKSSDDSK